MIILETVAGRLEVTARTIKNLYLVTWACPCCHTDCADIGNDISETLAGVTISPLCEKCAVWKS